MKNTMPRLSLSGTEKSFIDRKVNLSYGEPIFTPQWNRWSIHGSSTNYTRKMTSNLASASTKKMSCLLKIQKEMRMARAFTEQSWSAKNLPLQIK